MRGNLYSTVFAMQSSVVLLQGMSETRQVATPTRMRDSSVEIAMFSLRYWTRGADEVYQLFESLLLQHRCQRSDWKRHKTFCHDAVDKTLKLAQKMKVLHEMKKDNTGLGATYYWGNIPAVDLLNLSMNERGRVFQFTGFVALRSWWSKECSTYNCFVTWSLYLASQLCFKWHLSLHIGQNRSASIYVNKGMFYHQDISCLGYTVNDRLSASALIQFFRFIFC